MEYEDEIRSEEEGAAQEAGAIGGQPGPLAEDEGDPTRQPVLEAGGGESEGFEEAEAELVENAGDSVERRGLLDFGAAEEEEENRPLAEYGEADEVGDEGDPP